LVYGHDLISRPKTAQLSGENHVKKGGGVVKPKCVVGLTILNT